MLTSVMPMLLNHDPCDFRWKIWGFYQDILPPSPGQLFLILSYSFVFLLLLLVGSLNSLSAYMYFWSLIKIKINLGADLGGSSSEAHLFLFFVYTLKHFVIEMVYMHKVYIRFSIHFLFCIEVTHHFVGSRWGNSGNSFSLYFGGLQNHYRWWLQPWN